MPTLSPQSQALLAAFSQQPGVTPDQARNLQDILNGSPALIDQFNDAVAQGHLQRIVPLAHANAGGEYSPTHKEMRLPLARLTSPPNVGDMTFVLGHELQHGFNAASVRQAGVDFAGDVRGIAKSNGRVHDYTPAMANLLAANRCDEAGAEIAGWNAVVSAVKVTNPAPTLGDVHVKAPGRMKDFIDVAGPPHNQSYSLKSNLTHGLNADMTMSPTAANVEAMMGQNYFDKPAANARLGPSGTSDYVNYYGATLVGYVAEVERAHNPPQAGVTPPQMTFNMAQLRLSEELLEEKGIDLGQDNIGQQAYYDSSVNPPTAHIFQHTIVTHQHTNPVLGNTIEEDRAQARELERQSRQEGQPQPRPDPTLPEGFAPAMKHSADLRDPYHPGHDAFARTLAEVQNAETARGIAHGPHSERVAAALMLEAVRNGHGVTNVEIGREGRIVGVERGSITAPAKQVSIDSNQALSMSMEQYAAQWAQLRSPHYARQAPDVERTPGQTHALGQLSPRDQAMFAWIREGVPPHIADDVVASAMLQAKKDGIHSADQIDRIALAGDKLWIAGTIPGFRTAVDVSAQAPSLQETAQQTQVFNQQREQQLAMEASQREQEAQGRGFSP